MKLVKLFVLTVSIYQFVQGIYAHDRETFVVDDILLPFVDSKLDFFKLCRPKYFDSALKFVSFHHYSKKYSLSSKEIKIDNPKTLKNWKDNAPVRIFIHGFVNSRYSNVSNKIRKAYLDNGDFNVIIVDWSPISLVPCYRLCVLKVDDIGRLVANMIRFLQKAKSVRNEDIYIIGHSLGAHIAGAAGKHFSLINGGEKIPVIFGLDPAGPLFRNVTIDERLDQSDAKHVEVIHTDSEDGFGTSLLLGHADFFVNGGFNQPGCPGSRKTFYRDILEKLKNEFDKSIIFNAIVQFSNMCSHEKACTYFAESVRSSLSNSKTSRIEFLGIQCDSVQKAFNKACPAYYDINEYEKMGGEPCSVKKGIYQVITVNAE